MRYTRQATWLLMAVCAANLATSTARAQEKFSTLVGPVEIQPVASQTTLKLPYITWGGDVATFLANGGLQTASGTIYDEMKLKVELSAGDDFVQQVKDYLSGKTPFLRGTMRMLGQASEVIGSDPRTKPVVFLQLSFSAGDHMVAREDLKTLNDLKREGKKVRIACQQGGPHVGLLFDALTTARLTRDDVDIVFVPDLTGENGPAELFRSDETIDACCVITPDMIGLTGGLEETGTGAEGTVTGAHVLVSTQSAARSIADVYAVRADWYRDNRDKVAQLTAGYLKATQEVVKWRDEFEKSGQLTDQYRSLLSLSQKIFGEDVLPTLEVDAHGLLLDCRFVGFPGQIAFFNQSGNLSGFNAKMKSALDVATGWGYADSRRGFDPAGFDYREIAKLAGIEYSEPDAIVGTGNAENTGVFLGGDLSENTIVSFTISFEPNQFDFPLDRYRTDFEHALQTASTFGGATVVIRGHADPTRALVELIRAGMDKGLIRQTGSQSTGYKYFLRTNEGSKELDITQTASVMKLIESGQFESAEHKPLQVVQSALNLSHQRAKAVKDALVTLAKAETLNVNVDQLQPVGMGIADPIVSKPSNEGEARQNMRVEFRVIRENPETQKAGDFDF